MELEVTMPQMGESVVEGTIAKWLVKEGDAVVEDQPLCEISTDKVDTEIPSPGSGRIVKLLAVEGETLPVGAMLAIIESAGAGAELPEPRATKVGTEAGPTAVEPSSTPVARAAAPMESAVERINEGRRVATPRRYSPVALRTAAEHGINLDRVPGSGLGGRVSKRDVEHYIESLSAAVALGTPSKAESVNVAPAQTRPVMAPASLTETAFRLPIYQPQEGDVVEPFSRRRKLIAEHMVYSKTHAPHVGTLAEVDVTGAMQFREKHKSQFRERERFALTLLPLIAAATVRALKEFPRMNASVVGDSLVIRRVINLGVAMDTEEGLLVPVVRATEGMSLIGLARELERLRRKVEAKKITADDLAGGSFTLSNPGREGNLFGFAIINQPQVGILRMGEVKKRPIVIATDSGDAIAIRSIMYLALSYDHRVIDGVLANRFLYRVSRLVEESDFEL